MIKHNCCKASQACTWCDSFGICGQQWTTQIKSAQQTSHRHRRNRCVIKKSAAEVACCCCACMHAATYFVTCMWVAIQLRSCAGSQESLPWHHRHDTASPLLQAAHSHVCVAAGTARGMPAHSPHHTAQYHCPV